MADALAAPNGLDDAAPTAIAQLEPALGASGAQVIDGTVTITWPHSIVTKSIAFILAERDVLLRRDKGQVRVEFHGAAGRAVADAHIAGGDNVRLSLQGAEWIKPDGKTLLPVGSLCLQLKYSKRLLLDIQAAESRQKQTINIDAPADDSEDKSLLDSVQDPTPGVERNGHVASDAPAEKTTPPPSAVTKRLASATFDDGEYASPAFLKRARVSYGSLFDDGLDPFDEEGRKRKRKRSRFSLNVWRYSSRSPSPEGKEVSEDEASANEPVTGTNIPELPAPSRPSTGQRSMVDEGSQTQAFQSPSLPHFQAHPQVHHSNTSPMLPVLTSFGSQTGPDTPTRALFGEIQSQSIGTPQTFGAVQLNMGSGTPFEAPTYQSFGAQPLSTTSTAEAAGTLASMQDSFPAPSFGSGTTGAQSFSHALQGDGSAFGLEESTVVSNQLFGAVSQDNLPWHAETPIATDFGTTNARPHQHKPVEIGSSPIQEEQTHPIQALEGSRFANQVEQPDHRQSEREAEADREDDDDGKDVEGEDYDLRNYDDTRDDDEGESDEDREQRGSDADKAAVDLNAEGNEDADEDEVEDEEVEEDEEEEDDDEQVTLRRRESDSHRNEEFAGSGEDSVGEEEYNEYEEGNEEEEGYYDGDDYDEEVEEHAENSPPPPRAPKQPVFISLLSDSEDDADEKKAEPEKLEVRLKQEDGHTRASEERESQIEDEGSQSEAKTTTQPHEDEDPEDESVVDGMDVEETAAEAKPGAEDHCLDEKGSEGERDNGVIESPEERDSGELARPSQGQAEAGQSDAEAEGDDDEDDAGTESKSLEKESARSDRAKEQIEEPSVTRSTANVRQLPTPAATDAAPVTRRATRKQTEEVEATTEERANMFSSRQSPEVTHDQASAATAASLQTDQNATEEAEQSESQITTRSLRSRSHKKTMSSDSTKSRKQDPSVALVQSQPQRSPSPAPSPPSSPRLLRAYRNRTGNVDPSLALAQSQKRRSVSPAESRPSSPRARRAAKGRRDPGLELTQTQEKHSISPTPPSPRMLRAFKNRTGQADPSLALAKAGEDEPHPNVTTRHMAEQEAEEALHSDENAATEEPPHPNVTTRHMAEENAQEEDAPHPNVVTRGMEAAEEEEAHDHNTGHAMEAPPSPTARRSKRTATPQIQTKVASPEAALVSPSVAGSSVEDESISSLKRQLAKDLRAKLPDYLGLRSLRTSLNKTADILAVCASTPGAPYRPKNGPRDYMLEVALTDPSSAPTGVIIAHIFRPHQASLPVVQAGDVVLLRRMQVVSMKARGFGVRVGDASAWAVFEKGDEEMLPQIKGPPVEILDEEVEYAAGLRRWWALLDDKFLAKVERATQKLIQGDGK